MTATAGGQTLTWSVDGVEPVVTSTLSKPLLTVQKPTGPEYIYNDAFTMGLAATDDGDGYVVPVQGQRGRLVQLLRLADRRVSAVSVHRRGDRDRSTRLRQARRAPGGAVGRRTVRVRAASDRVPGHRCLRQHRDPRRFAATLLRPAPACTTTLTEVRNGPLYLRSGVTCLVGATINGTVMVGPDASLVATDSRVVGPVRADGAADLLRAGSTDH